ncbi:MAG: OmpH family outer membrane protein [Luteolibacter sp.]|uniref:OmpH family outer membrane protein n=1 Tax=Luteolibacter sp. TaxID=1962973 RepID=UPI00326504C1
MKPLQAIPLILITSALAASAAPKFALVRVKDIYSSLPSTTALQEQIKKERDGIMKDERAEQLRKIISELQGLQSQLSDKTKPLDEATSKSLARTYEIKRQEALTLQQEFEGFQTEQEKVINKKMVTGMRESLDRIAKVSAQISKERGYDAVFDSSGNTNTGVPVILFSKNAPDITADIQAALKDRESAVASEKKKDPAK